MVPIAYGHMSLNLVVGPQSIALLQRRRGKTTVASCLAAVFQPDLISWQPAYVDVELTGTLTLGQTVAYIHRSGMPGPPNMQVSLGADAQRFMQLFLERVKQL